MGFMGVNQIFQAGTPIAECGKRLQYSLVRLHLVWRPKRTRTKSPIKPASTFVIYWNWFFR